MSHNNIHILVTGSDGFIGQHVVRVAKARGHKVETLDRKSEINISDLPLYWFNNYDAIIHLAGSIDIKESFDKPWKYVEDNIIALKKLKQAKRVVFASSAAVYGEFSPYGYTKRLGESLLPENSVSLRLFNPYGPGEKHEPETHIVPLLINSINTNRGLTLFHGGKQVRSFIDVRDVAEAFVLAAESDITGSYDLCNENLSIREVADLIGADYALEKTMRDPGDTLRLIGDPHPLQQKLNWRPKYNVKEELKNWRNW